MLSPDTEIDRLRWHLLGSRLDEVDVNFLCYEASVAINEMVSSILESTIEETIIYAESIGAYDFIEDIAIEDIGSSYYITTMSGTTDFSTQDIHNLPNLLKNAKVAKDGSRYRSIPIRDNNSPKPQVAKSMFEQMSSLQQEQKDRRLALNDKVQAVKQAVATSRKNRYNDKSVDVHFRAATSKQNPQTQWVIPSKDLDMTQYLQQTNMQLSKSIDEAIISVIDRAMREAR